MLINFDGIIKGKSEREIEALIKENIPNIANARWISKVKPHKRGKKTIKISCNTGGKDSILKLLDELSEDEIIEKKEIEDVIFDQDEKEISVSDHNDLAALPEELRAVVIACRGVMSSTVMESLKANKNVFEAYQRQIDEHVENIEKAKEEIDDKQKTAVNDLDKVVKGSKAELETKVNEAEKRVEDKIKKVDKLEVKIDKKIKEIEDRLNKFKGIFGQFSSV